MKHLDWSINVECDLLKKGKQNEIFMMHSYIHNENDIALEGFRRCQTWFPFHKNHCRIQSKLQHMQINLWQRISCIVEQCFFFGQNFATWWQNKGSANLRKDFWEKWHKVAIFWGKKVKIATLLTKMEYDLRDFLLDTKQLTIGIYAILVHPHNISVKYLEQFSKRHWRAP